MDSQDKSFSGRAYRLMLRMLPFEFRGDFGGEMEEVFQDQRAEALRRRGAAGLLALWSETIWGIFRTAPREHLAILRQDARYALRRMAKEPGYVAIAVIILALGIGANTAIFSVLNAVLARPLPYAHGEKLLQVQQVAPKATISEMQFSVPEIDDYRRRNLTFEELSEYHSMVFTLLGQGDTERVRTGVISAGFFRMFGVTPALGRDFRAADEQSNSPPVLLMSHEYWQRKGSDPGVVGKVFRMNDREHTVIGVLPPMPQYPNENDVFMTTAACPFRSAPRFVSNREGRMMKLFGRLKPGVTHEQAQADLAGIARQLEQEYPEAYPGERGYEVISTTLKDEVTRKARPMLWLLMGAATFVFLIACANVANLTMSRLVRRERELLLRSALGASGSRLFRQLVTESLIVAGLAAGLGVLLASGGMELLRELAARLTPRAREISLDRSAFLFAFAGAALVSIIFGSLAALSSRRDLSRGLKDGGGYVAWRSRRLSLQPVLVICQVAFSFMLLIGAGLLTRSLINLWMVDPGFVRQNVVAANVDLNWARYVTEEDWRNVGARLLERLGSQPELLSAAVSSSFPLDPDAVTYRPWIEQFDAGGGPPGVTAAVRIVTPEYFETLGIPILVGRGFEDSDNDSAPLVAVVSLSFARRRWGEDNAIGKVISRRGGAEIATIVGVVGDVKEFGLNRDTPDEVYAPVAQHPGHVGAVLVRSAGDPAATIEAVRRAIRDVDPEIAITRVETLNQTSSDSLSLNRMTTHLLSLFAILALVIAVSGVSGMLSLSVSHRVREIAIRRALGASASNMLGLILRQGMIQVLTGIALGWIGAGLLTSALRDLLYEVTPTDPLTFWVVSSLLALAGLVACYIPAARAMRIEPSVVLKSE
jgi:putative ABC transport system permease protein